MMEQPEDLPMSLPQGGDIQVTLLSRQSITVSLPASDANIADWSMIPVTEHLTTSEPYNPGGDREDAFLFY